MTAAQKQNRAPHMTMAGTMNRIRKTPQRVIVLRSCSRLLRTQRVHRIDSQRSAHGNGRGKERDRKKQQDGKGERYRISSAHAVEPSRLPKHDATGVHLSSNFR